MTKESAKFFCLSDKQELAAVAERLRNRVSGDDLHDQNAAIRLSVAADIQFLKQEFEALRKALKNVDIDYSVQKMATELDVFMKLVEQACLKQAAGTAGKMGSGGEGL